MTGRPVTIRNQFKGIDPVVLAALVFITIGAFWLYSAVGRATPPVHFGTEVEEHAANVARPHVYASSGMIGLGGLALLARGRRLAALMVSPAAVLPAVLLATTPASWALPLIAAVGTIPLAVGTALATLLRRHRQT